MDRYLLLEASCNCVSVPLLLLLCLSAFDSHLQHLEFDRESLKELSVWKWEWDVPRGHEKVSICDKVLYAV